MDTAVAFFVYNRPEHTRKSIEALISCSEVVDIPVYFFSDGPRSDLEKDSVGAVRAILMDEKRIPMKTVIIADGNMGLANSIISGVSKLFEKFNSVIVLEDDLIVSEPFLAFMLKGLTKYRDSPKVGAICGYSPPLQGNNIPDYFFLRGADCWGWATWRRAWVNFNQNGLQLYNEILQRGLGWDFNVNGSYPYMNMLRQQIEGKNNSWAIRWQASTYLSNFVTLYSRRTLVNNIGFDGSGTHCSKVDMMGRTNEFDEYAIGDLPDEIIDDESVYRLLGAFYRTRQSWKFQVKWSLLNLIPHKCWKFQALE